MRERAKRNQSAIFDSIPTTEDLEKAEEYRSRFHRSLQSYARHCLVIIDRDAVTGKSNFIPFRFNASQLYLHDLIRQIRSFNHRREKQARHDSPGSLESFPVQIVELKARKVGWSTYLQARAFHKCEFSKGTTALTMAHEMQAAQNIVKISRRFVEQFRIPLVSPGISRKNPDLLEWDTKHDSRIVVKTAGAKTSGSSRSYTWGFVHISEEAHFKESSEVAAALAAKSSNAETHEESTASGIGGMFYENWRNAMWLEDAIKLWNDKQPFPGAWNGKFRAFWPWISDPAYTTAVPSWEQGQIENTLTTREEELIRDHRCTLGQIKWRRRKIAGECTQQRDMDPEEYFDQEYPTTPDDAFVSKGRNVFPSSRLTKYLASAMDKKPLERYNIMVDADSHTNDLTEVVHIKPVRYNPHYTQWSKPRSGGEYIIGIDTAEGLAHGDNSCVRVWDRMDGLRLELAASVVGKFVPDEIAIIGVYLAQLYNFAFIVPESSGVGISTCIKITRLNYPYVFHHDNPAAVSEDSNKDTFAAGFRTLSNTKKLLISFGQEALRNDQLIMWDPDGIHEWLHYQNEDGVFSAPQGEKDDRLMADLLAIYGHFSGKAPAIKMIAQKAEDLGLFKDVYGEWIKKKIGQVIRKAHKRNERAKKGSVSSRLPSDLLR